MTAAAGHPQDPDSWYEPASGEPEQGDILLDFPIAVPTLTSDGELVTVSTTGTVLILTQTCDIPKKSQQTLLLVQAFSYDAARRKAGNDHLNKQDYQAALARGEAIADFLLPPSPGGEIDYTLVHFRSLFVLPKTYVGQSSAVEHRLRLRSPYKEHFSQAYARFMMRVALPTTLSHFAATA